MTDDVTAIVPTYGRPRQVAACLESLAGQSVPPRLVVVDDTPPGGSADAVATAAKAHGARLVRPDGRPSLTRARNAGVAAAATEWICFLDSDATLPPEYLQLNTAFLRRHGATGGSGVSSGVRPSLAYRLLARWVRLPEGHPGGDAPRFPPTWTGSRVVAPGAALWGLHGSNMLIRRQAARGAFDDRMERYGLWEDLDATLTMRRRDPEATFVALPAPAHHTPAGEGRISDMDLFRMEQLHMRLLAWKVAPSPTPAEARRVERACATLTWLRAREGLASAADLRREGRRLAAWAEQHILPAALAGPIPFEQIYDFCQNE